MKRLANLSSILLLVLFSLPLWAAPGDLDTTFGGGKGWVSTGFQLSLSQDGSSSMIQQTDGKLVMAGGGDNGGNYNHINLARYNIDGTLDATFGNNGKLTTIIGMEDVACDVIQQVDGKLVVAGFSIDDLGHYHFALVRYNTDGSLDTSFSNDGLLTTSISIKDQAFSVIQQADGKLVVAGVSNSGSNYRFALVRYNIDGSLDVSFDSDGIVTTTIGDNNDDEAYSVIQQADGKLLVAGYSEIGNTTDFALVRYNLDGSLDTTFDGDGKVTTHIGSSMSRAWTLIQQADGKFVVAGETWNGNWDFALVRYNSDGSLDTTFDNDGKVITPIGAGNDGARPIFQQTDGKLLVAGYSRIGTVDNFSIVRYNIDGTLDANFNYDGILTIPMGGNSYASSVIQQVDGKILMGGSGNINNNSDFILTRYNSDGSLDTTFGNVGKQITGFFYSNDFAHSLIQQSDGKLVAGGFLYSYPDVSLALARYNSDGTLDTTFGGDGRVVTTIDSDSVSHYLNTLIQQSDSRLVIVGSAYDDTTINDFLLARYNSDGTLDTTFDGDGVLTTSFEGSSSDNAYSVIQQSDGKLVVAGDSQISSNTYFALARYNVDGSLDATFGSNGKLVTATSGQAYTIIQQSDGKLVVGGSHYNGSNFDFALARYNMDGSLDTTFDGDGILTTDLNDSWESIYSLIQQSDGKLVVVGSSDSGSGFDFALARYNMDGSLDTTFDGDGKLIAAIGGSDDEAYSVIQQADGKLVVSGRSWNGKNEDAVLARYNSDGSIDTSFGSAGKAVISFGLNDEFHSVIQQKDGMLIVAGYSSNMPTGQEFVVARIKSGQLDIDGDGLVNGLDPDADGDGLGDEVDTDDDNDGVLDINDAFPLDPTESLDTDDDGIGNNTDWDDDGDSVPDTVDAAPLNGADPSEITLPLNGVYKGLMLRSIQTKNP